MDAPEGYEEQLDDLSEKEILLELLVETKTIRYGLQTGDFGTLEREEREETAVYQCKECTKRVPEHKRQQHLVQQHNAPKELPVEGEFSEI